MDPFTAAVTIAGLLKTWLQERRSQGAAKQQIGRDDIRDFQEWMRRREHKEVLQYFETEKSALQRIEDRLAALDRSIQELAEAPVLVQQNVSAALGLRHEVWSDASPQEEVIRTAFGPKPLKRGVSYPWPEGRPVSEVRISGSRMSSGTSGPPAVLHPVVDVPDHVGRGVGPKDKYKISLSGRNYILRCLGVLRDVTGMQLEGAVIQIDEVRIPGHGF